MSSKGSTVWCSLFALAVIITGIRCLKADQRGKSFVVAFPYTGSDDNINLLVITAETDVVAFLIIPGNNDTKYTISAGSSARVYLPYETTVVSNMVVEKKGIHVVASGPVSVYGYLNQYDSIGGFLALPVENLSTEYIAVSYFPYDKMGGQIVIAATENDTRVEVTLKVSGSTLCNGKWIPDGETLSFRLNSLDVVRVFCEDDITGTYVKGNKPVAVLSGNPLSQVPEDVKFPDNLVEMLLPVYALGTLHSLTPLPGRSCGVVYRIVSTQDNTTIRQSNEQTHFLSERRSFVDLDLPKNTYACIISDKPVLVVQFGKGESADASAYEGDPFMTIIPPADRFTSSYVLDLFTATSTPGNEIVPYVTVVTEYSRKSGLSLLPASFTDIPDCDLSSGYVVGTEGSTELGHEDGAVFGAIVHGLVTWKGYGYMAGVALDDYSGRDECATSPCGNGICYELGFSYQCYCHGRYYGEHCEHAIPEATSAEYVTTQGSMAIFDTPHDVITSEFSTPIFQSEFSTPVFQSEFSTPVLQSEFSTQIFQSESRTPIFPSEFITPTLQSEFSTPTAIESTVANEATSYVDGTTIAVTTVKATETTMARVAKVTDEQTSRTSPCQCTCKNITYQEVQQKAKDMIKELTVDRVELSKSKRKHLSAPDNRLSASSIGYLGAAFLTLVFGCIFLIDLSTFISRRMQMSREKARRVHGMPPDVRLVRPHVIHVRPDGIVLHEIQN